MCELSTLPCSVPTTPYTSVATWSTCWLGVVRLSCAERICLLPGATGAPAEGGAALVAVFVVRASPWFALGAYVAVPAEPAPACGAKLVVAEPRLLPPWTTGFSVCLSPEKPASPLLDEAFGAGSDAPDSTTTAATTPATSATAGPAAQRGSRARTTRPPVGGTGGSKRRATRASRSRAKSSRGHSRTLATSSATSE